MKLAPGIYHDLPRDQYDALDAANNSTLNVLDHYTPAHALAQWHAPQPPTPAMALGQACHVAVLEPERFAASYAKAPIVDRRTKQGKADYEAFLAASAGKEPLAGDDWDWCLACQQAVREHPVARQLIQVPGHSESTVVWSHPETGVLCKARLDWATQIDGNHVVADVKTCRDADAPAFAKDAYLYGYYRQAAFYLDGLSAHVNDQCEHFYWIVLDKATGGPFVRVFEAALPLLDYGRRNYERLLRVWKACTDSGEWPAWPATVTEIDLPEWAKLKEEAQT